MTITKQNEKRMHKYEEIGKVFHDFRVNRNISLKQIADENVSISQISRFERGESDLSVSKFLIALENMKVETGEFMDALQKNHDSETIEFMSKLVPLEYKRDIAGFRKLFDEQRDKYKKNPSIYQYKLNMILAQSFICKCDPDVPFPKEYIDEVADYLFMVEQWKIYELILIGNLYLFFDIPLLHKMGKEIMGAAIDRGRAKGVEIITLLNIFETCIHREDLETAGFYMDNIPQLIEDETLLYERNLYHFLVGLFNYKNGDKAGGKAIMDQAILIYEWLGCRNLADNYKKDLEKYT